MLVVGRPEVEAYTPVFVSRDRLVIFTADCAHPDVQDIVYGCKVGHQCTIRRNLRTRLDGVAEQDIARNQGNGCRGSHAIPLSFRVFALCNSVMCGCLSIISMYTS